jgi:hypothetical protein
VVIKKIVERPETSVEGGFAAKRRKKSRKKKGGSGKSEEWLVTSNWWRAEIKGSSQRVKAGAPPLRLHFIGV